MQERIWKDIAAMHTPGFFITAEMPIAFVYPCAADMTSADRLTDTRNPAVKMRTGGRTYVAFTDFANNYHSFSILT